MNLVEENKIKIWFDRSKKETLEEYRKRWINSNIIMWIFLVIWVVSIMSAVTLGISYYAMLEDEVSDDRVLVQLGEELCSNINQTFGKMNYLPEEVLIHCSENNILIPKE